MTNEFFIDITFTIFPKDFSPYKFMVISGISKNNDNPTLLCFILFKFMDECSYSKIFNYLYENFNYNYFGHKIINTKCLFHYGQMIIKQLSKIGYHKKKLNKLVIEVLKNIEIICFIKKDKIKIMKVLLLKNYLNKIIINQF